MHFACFTFISNFNCDIYIYPWENLCSESDDRSVKRQPKIINLVTPEKRSVSVSSEDSESSTFISKVKKRLACLEKEIIVNMI